MNIGDTITGEISALYFSDGIAPNCDCQDCDGTCGTPPLTEGTYMLVRLNAEVPLGKYNLKIERLP